MKKLLLTIAAIAGFAVLGTAQDYGFQKGNVILEGSIQASSTNNRNLSNKQSNFSFRPKVGYFISDKFALGIDATFGQIRRDVDPESSNMTKLRATDFAAGVFGRYYFLEIGSRFKTYTEVGANYSHVSQRIYDNSAIENIRFNTSAFVTSAGIGANFFLTDKIAINYLFANLIGFSTTKSDGQNTRSTSAFSTNLNVFDNFFGSSTFGLTFKL